MRLVPNSWGSPLLEHNTCHNPSGHPEGGGRFCSKKNGGNTLGVENNPPKREPGESNDSYAARVRAYYRDRAERLAQAANAAAAEKPAPKQPAPKAESRMPTGRTGKASLINTNEEELLDTLYFLDTDDRGLSPEDVFEAFEQDFGKVKLGNDHVYVFDFEGERKVYDGSSVKSAEQFVWDARDHELADWTGDLYEDFWEDPAPLYHYTPSENVEAIKKEGLGPRHEKRGFTNRHIAAAVWASLDPEAYASGTYGDALFEIDTAAMKRDGYTPMIEEEDITVERRQREILARKLGLDDFHFSSIDDDIMDDDRIIHGHIPPKYLKLVG